MVCFLLMVCFFDCNNWAHILLFIIIIIITIIIIIIISIDSLTKRGCCQNGLASWSFNAVCSEQVDVCCHFESSHGRGKVKSWSKSCKSGGGGGGVCL
jgi:hypothetical protein